MAIEKQEGFTLVELSTSMFAGAILLLSFTALMVFTRQESADATTRVNILTDGWMLDRFVKDHLLQTVGDSLLIYLDSDAEQSENPSLSGTILTTKDLDGNIFRIAVSNQSLDWVENGVTQNIVDADVMDLAFQQTNSSYRKNLAMDITLMSAEDSIAYAWVISFRN